MEYAAAYGIAKSLPNLCGKYSNQVLIQSTFTFVNTWWLCCGLLSINMPGLLTPLIRLWIVFLKETWTQENFLLNFLSNLPSGPTLHISAKIFSDNRLCQCRTKNQHFRDLLGLHYQGQCGEWPHSTDIYTSLSNQCLFLLVYYRAWGRNQTVWSPIGL
jgi:hypothetical protein